MKKPFDPRTERRLGRAFIEAVLDIGRTPQDNIARFKVAKRNLERAGKKYIAYTGSDKLLNDTSHYGYTTN